jgi:hypothetical protein
MMDSLRGWMFWPGAASAVFLLQCGGDSGTSQKRVPARAGTGGMAAAGEGGKAGACDGCSGKGGTEGSAVGGAGSGAAGAPTAGSGGASGRGGSAGSLSAGTGAAGAAGGGGGAGSSGASGSAGSGGEAGGGMVGTVTLAKLSAYQAVEVTLFSPREPLRAAPVVIGRRALVRAFLTPDDGRVGTVTGTLTVDDGTTMTDFTASLSLDARSTQDALDSTLNFDIPATNITASTTLRLVVTGGGGELVRFPAADPFPLAAEDAHGNLQVTIVPLVVSGVTPDLSESYLKSYTSLLRGMIPVPNVDVIVRAPYTIDFDVTSDGSGWDEALDELYALRATEAPAENVYYYGVLTPGATWEDYCPVDCIVGLSVVASANEVEYRGSIGVGYFENSRDTFSPETMVHELGHAMGRDHSPCGTDDGDPRFPYSDGSIGSWGLFGNALRDPSVDADVMGYCAPVWVSDYTFDRLFTRLAFVNGQVPKRSPGPATRASRERVRTVTVRPDGSLRWGRERPGSLGASGTPTAVELLDAGGRVLSVVSAPFARFDHLPGGFVTLPASALTLPGVASVRALGRTLRADP